MSFRKEDAYQHALCMDLTRDKFRFSILDRKQKKILHSEDYSVADFSREGIASLLDNDLLKLDFAAFSLAVGGERNTLIPVDLFTYSKPSEIFRLNYAAPIDNLDYNRIPELGIVNIYELPLWLKTLFVIKFPRVRLVHRSTVLLKGAFDQPVFSPKIHLYIEEEQFYMLLTDKSKLVYFNRFDFKELADLVYYVLFVLEQKELDQKDFDILLYGVGSDWKEKDALKKFFSTNIKMANTLEKGQGFMLAKQLLCV